MNFSELQQKTLSELYDLYSNLKKEQLNLRLMAENKDTSRVRKIRRNVARIETCLNIIKKKA
ncbi:MAG: 50S ribosomal protein L29 [Alphaproteobacteria bacterium CG_4_10_14_0_8_um_filter_37_21]|nr:MAG: 50S ribosomal protein L29 [Alphaproteobacteria bacterium CG_4_10_14_0_8_um_filter_37_21]